MTTKSAFIAIVGRPNVGKSSLLNALVGEKVAIVSPKPQTTRTRVTGVLTKNETQLIFVDTPGLHAPRTKLGNYMVRQIKEGASGVDAAVLVCEPTGAVSAAETELIARFKAGKTPVILAMNKIDTLPRKEMMMEKLAAFSILYDFAAVVPVSVYKKDGIGILLETVMSLAKPGPHYFDDDDYTDQPERVIIAEIIREKLLVNLRDEIPHGIAVDIESMKERETAELVDIHAVIYCERESHKGIVIGKQGAMMKRIGASARADIENLLSCKINLQCRVKVKDDWRNREGSIHELGFR